MIKFTTTLERDGDELPVKVTAKFTRDGEPGSLCCPPGLYSELLVVDLSGEEIELSDEEYEQIELEALK